MKLNIDLLREESIPVTRSQNDIGTKKRQCKRVYLNRKKFATPS